MYKTIPKNTIKTHITTLPHNCQQNIVDNHVDNRVENSWIKMWISTLPDGTTLYTCISTPLYRQNKQVFNTFMAKKDINLLNLQSDRRIVDKMP